VSTQDEIAALRHLLRMVVRELEEHDAEYHHVTPADTLALLRRAAGGNTPPEAYELMKREGGRQQ
jgi:hypothetical protein